VKIAGLIDKIQKIITKKSKEPMLFVTLEDTSGRIEVIVFPKLLTNNPSVWNLTP